ncbi:Threonine/homoserine/homoserine lactone efflux protein [Quadrisphaera granulorum]|uniref:Threonine/homoserine/homoserine lactone efflux protein n=1 Tax=Quadrisphaera granulorum TaxID=317664 RepID=A0A315ZQ16_9ACTN|nr:LysE family translocator [Quadrisphaera granulorum]PWJ47616.1 threonine/homoserine/homoserine lactone efflux protein [Quadrisphaera granulorum]SZE98746.1 Threonine/homoserine/homoserine lactone efflux protein [Quadrisphaera granulorum]
MLELTALLTICIALLVGAISPGPSFVVTVQTSLATSRAAGLRVALGIGTGGLVFACLALGGLIALLQSVHWLYVVLKVMGALFILWLALKVWRGARSPLPQVSDAPTELLRSPFLRGLVVQLCNPKTAIVYASVFASLLPASSARWLYVVLPAAVFAVETSWYSAVAMGMSVRRARGAYARAKVWVDRAAAGVLSALGLRLLFTASARGI